MHKNIPTTRHDSALLGTYAIKSDSYSYPGFADLEAYAYASMVEQYESVDRRAALVKLPNSDTYLTLRIGRFSHELVGDVFIAHMLNPSVEAMKLIRSKDGFQFGDESLICAAVLESWTFFEEDFGDVKMIGFESSWDVTASYPDIGDYRNGIVVVPKVYIDLDGARSSFPDADSTGLSCTAGSYCAS